MAEATRTRCNSPTKTCTEADCARPLRARGLCQWHYKRARGMKTEYRKVDTPCDWCGKVTLKAPRTRYAARYCSLPCRDHGSRWSKGRHSCPVPDAHPSRSCSVPTDHPSRAPQPRRLARFHAGRCVECGMGYVIDSEYVSASSYCSLTCAKRTAKRARRAREAGASGTFTWDGFTKLALSLGNVCAYCGRGNPDGRPLEPDHVRPLSRGGHNGLANILPACRVCNGRKSNLSLAQWDRRLRLDGHPPLGLSRFAHLTAHVWDDGDGYAA